MIRDVGTRFDVNRAGASVRVAVIEGEVEVRERSAPATAHLVEAVQILRPETASRLSSGRAQDRLLRPDSFVVRPVSRWW